MQITLKEPGPGDLGWLISSHGSQYSQQFNFNSDFEFDIATKAINFVENADDFSRIFIAYSGNKRVGSIAVSSHEEKTAFINFLLVKALYRGQGIAEKLMGAVIQHTQDNDLHLIQLETYSCLLGARHLYRKLGFQIYRTNLAIEKYGHVFDQEFWQKKIR